MQIGERIRAYRKERGLTQKQLGEKCGMLETTIRKYEIGKAKPKIETLQTIAHALHVAVTDLRDDLLPQNFDAITSPIDDKVSALEAVNAAFGKTASDMLSDFTKLNDKGQKKAVDYIADLAEQPKYREQP